VKKKYNYILAVRLQ